MLKRKTVLGFAVALTASAALATVAQARDLTVVSWGGAYQDAQKKVYFEPFKKAAGVAMNDESWDGGVGVLRAKVQNTIYLGDHALAVLDVADNREFMVKLQPGTHDSLRAGSLTPGSLRPGDDVFITFRPEDCLALDPV